MGIIIGDYGCLGGARDASLRMRRRPCLVLDQHSVIIHQEQNKSGKPSKLLNDVMFLRKLLRRSILSPHVRQDAGAVTTRISGRARLESTNSKLADAQAAKTKQRAERVLNRVPKPFRKYTDGLRNAPVSHIVAFLTLHEITAIVPLVGLASLFHYTQWLPTVLVSFYSLHLRTR